MLTASGYCNGDDVFLAWLLPRTKNCWGVAIHRELKTASGETHTGFLENRTGFASDNPAPHSQRPSTEWPFQRYTWTDHAVGEGDTVRYEISPMLKTPHGLKRDGSAAVSVGPIRVTGRGGGGVHAFFNRGVLLSQFMAARLGPNFTKSELTKLKRDLAEDSSELRAFLSGQLGSRLARLLADARASKWHVYAALYELDDPALIEALMALGKKAHVILANGSKRKRGEDGNAHAAAGLDGVIDLRRRMLWSEGLGHNKFLVVAKTSSEPLAVWTGSTNWATTGLCTQVNNALLIEDPDVARVYLQQWQRLRDDRRVGPQGQELHFDQPLVDANDAPKTRSTSSRKWTVWFTRTSGGQDIDAVAKLINAAERAILFLMFEPGNNGLLQVIQARLSPASPSYDPDLYVHGVVNTLKPATGGEDVAVDLVGRGTAAPFRLRVVQPEGASGLAGWATEVTRRDFIMGQGGVIGHAIIHSKLIVLDPFTKPVVITGSHNFSHPASASNDENLLIVRDRRLAERYAVNVMSTYQHYRWRAYLQECRRLNRSPWRGLTRSDSWQQKAPEHNRELQFWVR